MNILAATVLLLLADGTPEPKDVKAGWLAFAIFLALIAATALLCVSFVRQLRKAQAAKDAGVYDEKK
jgi:Na+/melibiose symporter-like transporter